AALLKAARRVMSAAILHSLAPTNKCLAQNNKTRTRGQYDEEAEPFYDRSGLVDQHNATEVNQRNRGVTMKTFLATTLALGLLSAAANAQTPQLGPWQMVTGSQEGVAWKLNTQTGESYYCFRFNCFPSREATPQEVQSILQQQRATQPQR